MKVCSRCQQMIEGEADAFVPETPTGVAPTLYRHPQPCLPVRRAAASQRRRP